MAKYKNTNLTSHIIKLGCSKMVTFLNFFINNVFYDKILKDEKTIIHNIICPDVIIIKCTKCYFSFNCGDYPDACKFENQESG